MAPETQLEMKSGETQSHLGKAEKAPKFHLFRWARNRFFTGVIVAIPIVATFLAVSWIVTKIDANVFRIIPDRLNPETYLGFAIPGLGIIISIILRDVCLIEYPKKDVWAIGFVTADLSGKPAEVLGDDMVCVFVPTTPNPTSGFLLFVQKDTIQILDMTPEEGAKMIISGGMVSSSQQVALDAGGGVDIKSNKQKDPMPSL